MSMGELIDRSATFWRRHFGVLLRLYLGFQLVQYVVTKLYVFAMARWFPILRGGVQAMQVTHSAPEEALRQVFLGFASGGGTMLVYFLITWFTAVAGTRYAARAYLGTPITLGEATRAMWRRAGTIVGAFGLSLLWLLGVTLLLMIPGAGLTLAAASRADSNPGAVVLAGMGVALLMLGVVTALLWYLLRFFLTAQVIAMEDPGAVFAVRRSGALVSGRIGPRVTDWVKIRATILVTVVALILTAVGFVAGLPALLLNVVYGRIFDPVNADPDAVPQALLVPAELLQVLAASAIGPLYVVFGVLFYLDMRARREGLDLELRLDALRRKAT